MRRAFNRLEPTFNTRGKEFGMKLQAEADLDSKNESRAMGGNRCPDYCGEMVDVRELASDLKVEGRWRQGD